MELFVSTNSPDFLFVAWGDFLARLRTFSATLEVVAEAQLVLEMTSGRWVAFFSEAVRRRQARKFSVTFLAAFCDRPLARELRLLLLGELFALVAVSCRRNF